MSEIKGKIHSFESFGAADGPGVRYVIFVQGCKMRCKYCHNPDTWRADKGDMYTPSEIIEKALRYKSYWGKNGGITVSGGEPLLQMDFMLELFKRAKKEGIHTTIDTAGNPFTMEEPFFSKFNELMQYTDLVMLDIKEIDPEKHEMLTGCKNDNIIEMAEYLNEINKPVWIRHVLVPGITDFDEELDKLGDFIRGLNNVEKAEILPYHTFGRYKWDELGIEYPLKGVEPPTKERIENAKKKIALDL